MSFIPQSVARGAGTEFISGLNKKLAELGIAVTDFGAVGDGKEAVGSIAAGSKTLSIVGQELDITGATNATPIIVTLSAPHGVYTGTAVVSNVTGNSGANGTWRAYYVSPTQIGLLGSEGTGEYEAGGSCAFYAAVFSPEDVGKSISVRGAGPAASSVFTTIVSVTQTTAELVDAAASTVTDERVLWGKDNAAPFNTAATVAAAFRNQDSYEYGGLTLRVPKGVYLFSGSVEINLDRVHLVGDGSSVTTLRTFDGVVFPAPQELSTAGFARGILASDFGLELVKKGLITTTRTRHHNWSIEGLSLIGPGEFTSSNNSGLCLYECQQNGLMRDVAIADWGGHCVYVGYGSSSNNPESALFAVRDSWFIRSGLTCYFHTHEAYTTFSNVHAELSVTGDGFQTCGAFESCHVEYCRYGFNIGFVEGGEVRSIINRCSGFADQNFVSDHATPEAMISTDSRGVKVCESISKFFGNGLRVAHDPDDILFPEEETFHVAYLNVDYTTFAIHRCIQVGAARTVSGTPPEIPIESYATESSSIHTRWHHPAFMGQLQQLASALGLTNVLLLEPSVGEGDGKLVIAYAGVASYQLLGTLCRIVPPIWSTGGIQVTESESGPNVITLNPINFSGARQGGFLSVGSKFTGFPNWAQAGTSANAMFLRLGAEFFELRFGASTNTDGADPGTEAFGVDAGHLFIGDDGITVTWGGVEPEGSVSAVPGSIHLYRNGGSGAMYSKSSGSGNTGWVKGHLWTVVDSDTIGTPYRVQVADGSNSRALGISITPTSHIGQPATPIFSGGGWEINYQGRETVKSIGVGTSAPTTDGRINVNDFLGIGAAAPSGSEKLRNTGATRLESTVTLSGLSAGNKVLIADSGKSVDVSAVTDTELGYLAGVTSALQTQLNALDSRLDAVEAALPGKSDVGHSHTMDSQGAHTHGSAVPSDGGHTHTIT